MVSDLDAAKAHFFAGLDALQSGDAAGAMAAFEAALVLAPGRTNVLLNLAAARLQAGHPEGALDAARTVLAADATDLDAHYHAGCALLALGRLDAALAALERAAQGDPAAAPPWLRRGQVLQAMGRSDDALTSFDRALAADATLAEAWSYRGSLLRECGRLTEADAAFATALAHGADPALHGFYRAATGTAPAPDTAPRQYVEPLFDEYAAQFDNHLVGALRYRAHTELVALVQQRHPGTFGAALDLGCGTGLVGACMAAGVGAIDGVDVSFGMLEAARNRAVYRALAQDDVAAYLGATDARYDIVLAADVFIYIGALEAVFTGARRVLSAGGVFAFTVETMPDGGGDYALHAGLRYAHSAAYVRRLAAAHGMVVTATQAATLREEQRQAIAGLVVCLQRE